MNSLPSTRITKLFLPLGLILILASEPARSLPQSHSPFFAEEDNTVALNICTPVERNLESVHPAKGQVTFTAPSGRRLTLTMDAQIDPYDEKYFATITDAGIAVTPRVDLPLVATVVHLLPDEAICDDLNGDGITDFITTHSLHGNGLGARSYDRVVMLSSQSQGYRYWLVRTMDPSPQDFQQLQEGTPTILLTTSFANSGGDTPHSYLVFDLWRFEGDQLLIANDLDKRFPKWVWMTISENHKPAASLSPKVKREMLAPRSVQEILITK